ncbi:hypothetical protein GY45DRAFT_46753 [Cubamyces sp. BRFM 1775]|nr:hypothetical protein GY45DRAFT_46753 [Cubamyces sp. BRFM 1775]
MRGSVNLCASVVAVGKLENKDCPLCIASSHEHCDGRAVRGVPRYATLLHTTTRVLELRSNRRRAKTGRSLSDSEGLPSPRCFTVHGRRDELEGADVDFVPHGTKKLLRARANLTCTRFRVGGCFNHVRPERWNCLWTSRIMSGMEYGYCGVAYYV